MKPVTILFVLILAATPFISNGQSKVKEKDIIGTWKLVIDIDKDVSDDEDEAYEGRDVDESFLGHIISSSAKALVENLLDQIDIRFVFRKDGRLDVYAMDERDDDNDNEWHINSKGELIITNRHDRDDDEDEIWLLKDDKLVAYEKHGSHLKEKEAKLVKVD